MTDKGMVSEQAVMAALGQVQEPELHKDLVTLEHDPGFEDRWRKSCFYRGVDHAGLPAALNH